VILVWVEFLVCAAIIVIAGTKVAKYGDVIAEKTGLGGAWIGVVLLAITTSLPEVFNGISAVVLVGEPDLTIGNAFGANAWNLFNLALLDTVFRGSPPLFARGISHGLLLTLGLSMVLVSLAAAGIFISAAGIEFRIGWIGAYTPIILLLYLLMVRMIFKYEKGQTAQSPDDVEASLDYRHVSLARTYIYFGVAAAFVIGTGIWLAFVGDRIADITGWGEHFVGMLLISFTTTLPEMTVTSAALKLGAVDMAIGNIIGSNLFNMAIISLTDSLYTRGPILAYVSEAHVVTGLAVLLMSSIMVAAKISPPQRRTFLGASWYAIALMVVFVIGAYLSFTM
jgi:cation:H+ antiporter